MTTGQSKESTEEEAPKNVFRKDRQQSSNILRHFGATSIDLGDEQSCETVKQLPSSYNHAFEWMQSHNSDIITALQLLHIYPKLIRSDIANSLSKLIKPLLNQTQPSEIEEEVAPLAGLRKVVYVCGRSEYVGEGVTAKDRIIASLSCYCRVQTHPDPPPQEENVQDALEEIKSSEVFILLLNDDTLNCWFSLYRLAGAVTHNIPIITIRDSSFELSDCLPQSFYQTEILTDHNLSLGLNVRNESREHRLTSSRSSGFHSACSQTKYSESGEPNRSECCLLADVVKTCYLSSMKYVSKFHDSCVAKLFGKLSDYLGESFLDLEISNHFGRYSPDGEIENGKASSVYFSKSAILRKRNNLHFKRRTGNATMISNLTTPFSDKTPSTDGEEKTVPYEGQFEDNTSNDCDSPFVHKTNYMVFPSRSPSSARKSPYVVSFPDEIDKLEKEDNDNVVSPYGDFDNVPLDVTAPLKDSPPSSPASSPPGQSTDNKDATNKDKDTNATRETKIHKKESKNITVVMENSVIQSATKKTIGRRTAKLPKINLEVHDVRVMRKHIKTKKLGKSVSL